MLGVHCGLAENVLDECSFIYYQDCIKELSVKLSYSSIVHILGNSNLGIEEGFKGVMESNPFNINLNGENTQGKKKLTIEDIEKSGVAISKVEDDNGSPIMLIQDMIPKEDIEENG